MPVLSSRGRPDRLVVVAGGYPAPGRPNEAVFTQEFAWAMARQGVRCLVVNPVPMPRAWDRRRWPLRSTEQSTGGAEIEILRPSYFSCSARGWFRRFGPLNPSLLTWRYFTAAAQRALVRVDFRPDAIFGEFLYFGGAAAVRIGRQLAVPAFPGVGEGEFWSVRKFGAARARRDLTGAAGFLAYSIRLRAMLGEELAIPPDRVGVFPNGVDRRRFRPQDRAAARHALNLPPDRFLVGCVGHYLYKKGPVRVGMAIDGLPGVGGVFAGYGPMPPTGPNVLFSRSVPHEGIPPLLAACDVFVLPTLVEGSCNALIEAMACGLPVISSDGAFNDDLLSSDMSLRVGPMDVAAIRAAVVALRDDPARRAAMAAAALRRAAQFDIDDRAARILDYMSEHRLPGDIGTRRVRT